jgi:glycosyltransferase involved in cell wall biosynthesis
VTANVRPTRGLDFARSAEENALTTFDYAPPPIEQTRTARPPRREPQGDPVRVTLIANSGWNMVRFRGVLIDALLERGHEVTLIADFSETQVESMCRRGARPIPLELDGAGIDPRRDLVYLLRLVKNLRALRPDVVHLFSIKPLIYGALLAKLARIPVIVASVTGVGILSGRHKKWLRPVLRSLVRTALSACSHVIFQNGDDRDSFVAKRLVDPSRTSLIAGSGVDTSELSPDPDLPPTERTTFVMVSRMLWSKGVADFVAAAHLVKQRHPHASFVLYGGVRDDYGSKNPDFIDSSWLHDLAKDGVVEWRGWTHPSVVEAAMRTAAAVVLPSYYGEGVPRCLIEAAAAGTPIITTDMPGCRDTVTPDQSGFLCPPRAPDRLADAMNALLASPCSITSMGREGRRLAVTRFDKRLIVDQILRVYEDCLSAAHQTKALHHG